MLKMIPALLIYVVVATFAHAEEQNPSTAQKMESLGVGQLMKEPDQHKGSIVVTGVVKAVYADKHQLTLMECCTDCCPEPCTECCKECETTNCVAYILPVQWKGEMPSPLETVRVEGQVQKQHGKSIFVATKLETVKQESASKPADSKCKLDPTSPDQLAAKQYTK